MQEDSRGHLSIPVQPVLVSVETWILPLAALVGQEKPREVTEAGLGRPVATHVSTSRVP